MEGETTSTHVHTHTHTHTLMYTHHNLLLHVQTSLTVRSYMYAQECQAFLHEDLGTVVNDRRHKEVIHLAQAVSVRDLRSQVQAKCPEGTKIPSIPWIRLRFWPKTRSTLARMNALYWKARWYASWCRPEISKVSCIHYAAAIFRYEREMSLLFRGKCVFVCLDDKHRIKIGKPGYPVAAMEQGRRLWSVETLHLR